MPMSMVDNPALVSFIIVNYRSDEDTLNCVRSIVSLHHSHPCEIIVVNNSPEEGTLNSRLNGSSNARYIPLKGNPGFAKAVNRGIRDSGGEIIILVNPDVVFTDAAIEPLISSLEKSDFSIIGPKILNSKGQTVKTWHTFPAALIELRRYSRNKFFKGRHF
ncbi:MAG: glycosyltransferase, partial [Candidatus Omnitrophica bacterium]|nr:glycosyltransferase [Candidatus Omnitrophota bacterium]